MVALILTFGGLTTLLIRGFDPAMARSDVLLLAASSAALLTAGLWIALLAFRRSRGWAWTMGLGIWIPYVNLMIATVYARRYWREETRAAGWLAIVALALQSLAALRLLLRAPTPLV